MAMPAMRIGGRSVKTGMLLGWSPTAIRVARSITICTASVARIITNIVALRSHSGRTTSRSITTPSAATATVASAPATDERQPEHGQQHGRHHAAEHHEGALREVHDPARVVDDAEADADQAVDAADAEPVDQDLAEIGQRQACSRLRAAEIGLDHRRVALHLGGAAFGDLAAKIEHDDPVGGVHDQLHVVLDQEHGRAALVDAANDARQPLRLLVIEAGGRLVEQQAVWAPRRAHARSRAGAAGRRAAAEARRSAWRRRPTNSISSRATRSVSASSRRAHRGRISAATRPALVRTWRPTLTFSSTVRFWNSCTSWKVRTSPRRGDPLRARPRSHPRPRRRCGPLVGGRKPEIMLNSVVLPAPFGPMTAVMPSARNFEASRHRWRRRPSKRRVDLCDAQPAHWLPVRDASFGGRPGRRCAALRFDHAE